ncbi:thioester domain-containing protein [Actinokineospora spheciospongiae]|uniref:thioester domain-containing protein n=1 Tax=Actinokineospora spheciospongiae TaxID=909613 RepID=UPI000D80EFB7|nr:thioester domain-containing protein [Actinokineospora spheciospongiae]PWW62185.1 TQXA domain-containing protein [Actinokineospora spheciospongiae]
MGKRFTLARAGAVMAVAAVTASVAALPAAADTARGRLQDGNAPGLIVNLKNNKDAQGIPLLRDFELADGSTLRVYCVEITVDASKDVDMVESGWDKYPVADSPFHKNRDKINWVLHHGFPGTSLESLGKLPLNFNDGLAQNEAVSATQTAIWHFSDGVDLDRDQPIDVNDDEYDPGSAKDVLALYDYLVGDKNTGIAEQVIGDLKISPDTQEGSIGGQVGPFKVTTNGTVTGFKADLPEGVELTTAEGKVADKAVVGNDTELFFKVPAGATPGSGSFELTADSPAVETGRLFVGEGYDKNPVQSLIVASSETKPLTATAKATWGVPPVSTTPVTTTVAAGAPSATPVPQGSPGADLADTGASILVPALIGLGLVGAGAGALIHQRRRKAA